MKLFNGLKNLLNYIQLVAIKQLNLSQIIFYYEMKKLQY